MRASSPVSTLLVRISTARAARATAAALAGVLTAGALAGAPSPAAAAPPATETQPAAAVPLTAPDAASAALTAQTRDARVEVLAARTETSSTFANPDGTWTTESTTRPTRVRTTDGTWQPINPALEVKDGELRPKAAAVDYAFSAGGTDPFAKTRGKGRNGKPQGLALGWGKPLPTPQIKGATATYPDVLPGADLVVRSLGTGFAHDVVYRTRPTREQVLQLPMQLDGLTVEVTDTGAIVAKDAAGEIAFYAPRPRMWDARINPDTGEPAHVVPVTAAVSTVGGQPVLVLTPDPAFLSSPDTVYPVTVDPSFVASPAGDAADTWLQYNDYLESQYGSNELKVGTYNGTEKARSFLKFDVSKLAGKKILDANLRLYNSYSSSCTGAAINAMRLTAAWDPTTLTWSNQPAATTASLGTVSTSHGYSSACPGSFVEFDVPGIVQAWANGTANYGLTLRAGDETNTNTWRRYRSANYASGTEWSEPKLNVSYNSYPNTPSATTWSPKTSYPSGTTTTYYSTTTTPTVSAKVSDPDGGSVKAVFDILDASTGSAVINDLAGSTVSSGSTSSVKLPAGKLVEGRTYKVRAYTSDGSLTSKTPYDSHFLVVDTTKPDRPTVSSTLYKNDGTWNGAAGQAGSFTIDPPDGDTGSVAWTLDDPHAAAGTSATTTGAAVTESVTPPAEGEHTLYVWTRDRAGLYSSATVYTFNVGAGVMTAPVDGDTTAARFALAAEGRSEFTGVRFQYRRGDTETWRDVPLAHVTADGQPLTAWPVATVAKTNPDGSTNTSVDVPATALSWDAGATLGADLPVQVRAVFTGSTTSNTLPVRTTLDRQASAAASEEVGPGTVNLLTGDYLLSDTDASVFGLSAQRSASSRDPDSGYLEQAQRLTDNQATVEVDTSGFSGPNTVRTRDTTITHDGEASLKVTPTSTLNFSTDTNYTYAQLDGGTGLQHGLKPGGTYRLAGWVYLPNAASADAPYGHGLRFTVQGVRSGGGSFTLSTAKATTVGAWQHLSADVTVPADATSVFVRFYNGNPVGSTDAVYLDDVSLRELTAPFGPSWSAGAGAEIADTDYRALHVLTRGGATAATASTVAVEFTDGSEVLFTKTSTGAWAPEPGAETLTLTSPTSGYTLTDDEGTVTTFAPASSSGTDDVYLVTGTQPSGSATGTTTSYSYDVTGPTGYPTVRLRAVYAPHASLTPAQCDPAKVTPTRGCRVLEYVYADTTTATTTALGDVAGQVRELVLWAAAPGASSATKTAVATFRYDQAGRLREAWDPRISPALKTTYGYDSAGRVTTVTPPGELPWTLTYGSVALNGDTNPGRLLTASRPELKAGTATETTGETVTTSVVYGVPLTTAAGGPHDMTATHTARWGQTGHGAPTDATAVFPPDQVPTGHSGAVGEWTRASISYLDVNGRAVNTATPGGHIDATGYDRHGNTIRELTAANRALALRPAEDAQLVELGIAVDSEAERVGKLSNLTTYDETGVRQLEEYGPLHLVTVPDVDGEVPAREHETNTYDEGRPADAATANLVTSSTVGARVEGATSDVAVRNTTTAYDWTLGLPTQIMRDEGGVNEVRTTAYDPQGRVLKTTMPASNGADAGATLTYYYTAGAHPQVTACGNRPEWDGLPCQQASGGAITGALAGQPTVLPTTTTTYTWLGDTDTITETSTTASGVNVTRTTTTTYDAAGREIESATTGGFGTATPVVETRYDPATGEVAATRIPDGTATPVTISRRYDALGRQISYTDADGAITETSYDKLDRPVTISGGDGSTTTYTYDHATEPRGLATAITDSVAGKITGNYDPDGSLTSQTLPGGVTMTQAENPAGSLTRRSWTKTGDTIPLLDERVSESIHGQWITHDGRASSQTFTYDGLGRLTGVLDRHTDAIGQSVCTNRAYGFDKNSNRTHREDTAATDGTCPDAPATSTTDHTYDSADRLVDPGHTYDAFGRTTALPDGVTVGYYTNDLAASMAKSTGEKQTWTLDPDHRFRAYTITEVDPTAGVTVTTQRINHYSGDGDSPSWVQEGPAPSSGELPPITRNVSGLDGDLVAYTSRSGDVRLQLTNLHGDVTLDIDPTATSPDGDWVYDNDEYGNPHGDTRARRYGWLGGEQRSSETITGAILMGVRLYNPTTGRFLSVDPVQGGSCNAYEYTCGDPVNVFDLDGRAIWVPIVGCIRYCKYAWRGAKAAYKGAKWGYRKGRSAYRSYKRRSRSRSCRYNSFTPETLVVMGDRSTRPISALKPGDLVLATDEASGVTRAYPIEETIRGFGVKELVEVGVDVGADGRAGSIFATSAHPLYVIGQGWTDAGELRAQDSLLTPDGASSVVTAVSRLQRVSVVHNLKVVEAHTYYVSVDGNSVLAHNCPDDNEHTKNARPSTKGKHQKGKARKKMVYNDKKRRGDVWRQNPNKRRGR